MTYLFPESHWELVRLMFVIYYLASQDPERCMDSDAGISHCRSIPLL